MGFTTWSEAATAARDRAGWRRQVNGPILPEAIQETSQVSFLYSNVAVAVLRLAEHLTKRNRGSGDENAGDEVAQYRLYHEGWDVIGAFGTCSLRGQLRQRFLVAKSYSP